MDLEKIKPKRRERERDRPRRAAELVELALAGEDDESHLGIAEKGEFIGLFEKPISSLCKTHLPIYLVLDSLQLHLPSPHYIYMCIFGILLYLLSR